MTSSQFLESCLERNRDYLSRAVAAVQNLPLDRLNHRNVEGDWSPGQIFRHLILSNDPYMGPLTAAVKTLPVDPTNPPVQNTWFGRKLAEFAGPNKNVPAPKPFVPPDEPVTASVVQEWASQQQKLIDFIEAAKGRDINKKFMKNPVMKMFGMNMADCFLVLTEHTDRHVRQIEERSAGSC